LVGPEFLQAGDVRVLVGAQHEADWGHVAGGNLAAQEQDVDQATADPSVPIPEGMDRLELGVSDRRLDDGGDVIAVCKRAQVTHEMLDMLGRWGDIVGFGG